MVVIKPPIMPSYVKKLIFQRRWKENIQSKDASGKKTHSPKTMVVIKPPIKPSHVFFGDNLMSGVLPVLKIIR